MRYKKMVRRTATHVTDTLAVRSVIQGLPPSLLVRSLEERDYGIDMMLELFDREYPTGNLVLVQVKGRQTGFGKIITLRFPVKTLLYAELFTQPFFVFYSSIKAHKTYFVWLQKYIQLRLERDRPQWRDQSAVTIEFPRGNVLSSGGSRIVEIATRQRLRDLTVSFLAESEWLVLHAKSVLDNQVAVAQACLDLLPRISAVVKLVQEHGQHTLEFDVPTLERSLNSVKASGRVDARDREIITHQLKQLGFIKNSLLNLDQVDELALELSDYAAY